MRGRSIMSTFLFGSRTTHNFPMSSYLICENYFLPSYIIYIKKLSERISDRLQCISLPSQHTQLFLKAVPSYHSCLIHQFLPTLPLLSKIISQTARELCYHLSIIIFQFSHPGMFSVLFLIFLAPH